MSSLDFISQSIVEHAKVQGRTLKWVAEEMDINYKTFIGKINRNSITAYELLKLSMILQIDLEALKVRGGIRPKAEMKRATPNTMKYLRMSDRKRDLLVQELSSYIKELKSANFTYEEIMEDLSEKYSKIELVDIFLSPNYTLTVLPNSQDKEYMDVFDRDSDILIMEKNISFQEDTVCRKSFTKGDIKIESSMPCEVQEKEVKKIDPSEIPNGYRAQGIFFDYEVMPEIINAI